MTPAPYFTDLAGGPEPEKSVYLTASDGVRIRSCYWRPTDAPRGTVLMFNGRTEYAEKYGKTVRDFTDKGYVFLTSDWRGQGAADRLLDDPAIGHVEAFSDYQKDADAIVAFAEAEKLPKPWFLVGHSMGGAIGYKKLTRGLDVKAAVFSSPMWGIYMSSLDRMFSRILPGLSRLLGRQNTFALRQTAEHYVEKTSFEDNVLTGNETRYMELRELIAQKPELGIGGPSYQWVDQALKGTSALHKLKKPDIPALVLLGTEEQTVDPEAVKRLAQAWPSARLQIIDGGYHEMLMDVPQVRDAYLAHIFAHFDRVLGAGAD